MVKLGMIMALRDLAYREHFTNEDDCYYSCACAKIEDPEQPCDCGADDHNGKVSEVYSEILETLE